MNNNTINCSVSLTGWPAALTCCFGFFVLGTTSTILGIKLIDNKYQLTNPNGVSITSNQTGNTQPIAA